MGKTLIVGPDGSRLLRDFTPEEAAEHDARLAKAVLERPTKQKKRIDRRVRGLINSLTSKSDQARRVLSALTNKRAKGGTLTAPETAKENAALALLAKLDTFDDRAIELKDAVDAGKKIDWKKGTIDGVGSWPSVT